MSDAGQIDAFAAAANLDEKRIAHCRAAMRIGEMLMARLAWDRPAIEAERLRALRRMVAHCQVRSPWHAERMRGLDPDTMVFDDLAHIPPMTKADLMENWDRIVTVPGARLADARAFLHPIMTGTADQDYYLGEHTLITSGGSSGKPGIYLFGRESFAQVWWGIARAIWQVMRTKGFDDKTMRIAGITAGRSAHGSYAFGRIFNDPDNPTEILSIWQPWNVIVDRLNQVQPDLLYCTSSMIPQLCASYETGRLRISPHVMFGGGEYLSYENRRRARTIWPHCDVLVGWGSTEAGGGTHACRLGNGFHVSEDQCVLEPIDATGIPVAPGTQSAGVLVTNLVGFDLPVIRILVDDVFEMAEEPCPCGSAYHLVKQVHGRLYESFHYETRDGARALHPAVLELGILQQGAIGAWQMRQTANGVVLLIERGAVPIDVAEIDRTVRAALGEAGLVDPDVTVEMVDRIERVGAGGKLMRFVPRAASS